MKLLFASHNQGKIEEVKSILTDIDIVTPPDLEDDTEVEETGSTLQQNAFLKANHYYRSHKMATFADDTGLIVPVLKGAPGVRSARFAGENATYEDNNRLLLSKMANFKEEERFAYFLTVICYITQSGNVHYFRGELHGIIDTEIRGDNGFGYDPLFRVRGMDKTLGELPPAFKNTISHRYQALAKFYDFLKGG
ncbi:MAG: RdgB/HAM1 family non-canonical purine NTP pyrophosphatase [Bacilli bacterium]|nr:RdgB/HAM1 family non-canonical purine NTP pyrophosphatase [Bacilli bacterium]MDD4076967.1 RdgB/HAM1 family non-canonical purine NTP pyrophosphatase [Bacilli bacterium]